MRELKVMVTILVKDSWKKITEPSMITQPWKMDFHVQIRKVLVESARPFWRPEYRMGNFMTADSLQSSSVTRENTGNIV